MKAGLDFIMYNVAPTLSTVLSSTEKGILLLLSYGATQREISSKLHLSQSTIFYIHCTNQKNFQNSSIKRPFSLPIEVKRKISLHLSLTTEYTVYQVHHPLASSQQAERPHCQAAPAGAGTSRADNFCPATDTRNRGGRVGTARGYKHHDGRKAMHR